jgi:glycosyltransferase involved in cell wall biosynthesis
MGEGSLPQHLGAYCEFACLPRVLDRERNSPSENLSSRKRRRSPHVSSGNSGRNFRREHALDEKFVVMYAGAVGMANDVDCLLSAANRLRRESDVVFAIVGAGKELPRLPQQAAAMRLENICFSAPQPKQRVPEALAAADVCVATLENIPMFRHDIFQQGLRLHGRRKAHGARNRRSNSGDNRERNRGADCSRSLEMMRRWRRQS